MHSTTHSDDHCQAQGWEDHLSCAEEVIAIIVFSVLYSRIIASSETLLLLFPISSESFVFSIILTRKGLGQPNVKFKIDERGGQAQSLHSHRGFGLQPGFPVSSAQYLNVTSDRLFAIVLTVWP